MELLPTLLGLAVLLPLIAFAIVLIGGPRLGKGFGHGAYVSVAAILGSALLSFASLFVWLGAHWPESSHHGHGDSHTEHTEPHAAARVPISIQLTPVAYVADKPHVEHGSGAAHDDHDHASGEKIPPHITGNYYTLGRFQDLEITISYYIDSLTVCMFCMVTLIASCIHFYAMGYMHDELHEIVDHEVTDSHGHHLHRPGRFWRFFQALSLFCFSMLGLVLSGNIAMVFCFWELVGICSYFLIGFYVERKSASTAANKAFIVNRVGDFGMIIGLMALWSSLGTFAFGDLKTVDADGHESTKPGLFSLVRNEEHGYQVVTPDDMVVEGSREEVAEVVRRLGPNATQQQIDDAIAAKVSEWRGDASGTPGTKNGYWLLVVAGVGIFCGCVGKSAQFPLHVWLPDAMEGPTPVSALVHSATMVAAGVYLVGRFFPVFCPEVLLVIAITGTITLFLAATIALTATDIKRVLAYSTVSQLGYMMMALGVGGWTAGLMHLITHAFFKSLLFMCSGSVIHAVHTNEMPKMGGLLKKMPITAITMLIGCLAIAGAGIPYVIGFSGYYSKDAILEQAYSFGIANRSPYAWIFFFASAGGAAITAFYMFRMWFMTFVGEPRDRERYDHAHESPPVMYVPLIILSVFAISVAWSLPTPNTAGYAPFLFWPAAIGFVGVLFYLVYSSKPAAATHAHVPALHSHDVPAHSHDDHGAAQAESRHAVHPAEEHHAHEHDDHAHAHHHETPRIKWGPIVTMAALLMLMGLTFPETLGGLSTLNLRDLLEQSRPTGTALADAKGAWVRMTWPAEYKSHDYAILVTFIAFCTALSGVTLAAVMYWFGYVSADEVRRQFAPVYRLLWNKWYFDELYNFLFVRPTHVISRFISSIDRNVFDRLIDGLAYSVRRFAVWWEYIADRTIVDGLVNVVAGWMYSLGLTFHRAQTGQLRQYVMFIVVGAVAVFLLISFFWNPSFAR